jgi:hypothetical protein
VVYYSLQGETSSKTPSTSSIRRGVRHHQRRQQGSIKEDSKAPSKKTERPHEDPVNDHHQRPHEISIYNPLFKKK